MIADYFVICSGNSERQADAIAGEVEDKVFGRQEIVNAAHIEGKGKGPGRWILLDYSDVIVHVFTQAERDYYRLEKLWVGAKKLV